MSRRTHRQRKDAQGAGQSLRNRTTDKDNLSALQKWFLPDESIFAQLKFHGNTTWSPGSLVWLAVYWAWSESRHVTDAFVEAVGYCRNLSSSSCLSTYQGFMGALVKWTPPFIDVLCRQMHERMAEIGGRFWRSGEWVAIAFDGSRSTAPRTSANEQAFCAAHYGRGQTARYRQKKSKGLRRKRNQQHKPQPQAPQVWITLLWHMGLRLPWRWRLGPSNASERAHVMDMVRAGDFPKNTLFCGDAGFVGYPLWSHILHEGADFLVRVGANVSLLAETAHYQRQPNGEVLCWPKAAQHQRQPPLQLRLVKVRIGKAVVWLLTSVCDARNLTVKQMIKLYKMRWGVEVEFRGLKQTLNRARLRCRHDQRLLAELHWSLLAMALAELFAVREQLSRKGAPPTRSPQPNPARRSLAKAIRAIRHCLRHLLEVPPQKQDLHTQLRLAVTDNYRRTKPKRARYRPPNPDKKPLGNPKLRKLTPKETKQLRQQIAA